VRTWALISPDPHVIAVESASLDGIAELHRYAI
jgi:hypothetical protein